MGDLHRYKAQGLFFRVKKRVGRLLFVPFLSLMGWDIEFKETKDSKQNKNKRIPPFSWVAGLNWLDLVIYLWVGSFF